MMCDPLAHEGQVDFILNDCFLAIGEAVSAQKQMDYEAVVWWRDRYRAKFLQTLRDCSCAWPDDRRRLMAVSRYLGLMAVHHAGDAPQIDLASARRASSDVETGCRMQALEVRAQSERSSSASASASTSTGAAAA